MERLADSNTELKEQERLENIRLARIEQLTLKNQGMRLTRNMQASAMKRKAEAEAEAKEQKRLSRIQEITDKNSGKARTRSVLKAIVNEAQRRTPTKPPQPLQTTDISLQDATEKPSQSTAPPNKIQGDTADLSDLGDLVRVDEYDEVKYKELKPFLESLKIDYPTVDELREVAKLQFGPASLNDPVTGKPLNKSALRFFIANELYASKLPSREDKVSPQKQTNLDAQLATEGSGLRRMKRIVGRGKAHFESTLSKRKYISDEKFYIDTNKLNDNILSVKYAKTEANIPSLRTQSISTDLKELIQDAIEGKYDNRIFKKLTETDKRVFKRFCSVCKINDIEIDDPNDKLFQQRFEILKSEWLSGNSSPQNKQELKRVILEAYASNKIPRNEAMLLLFEISL